MGDPDPRFQSDRASSSHTSLSIQLLSGALNHERWGDLHIFGRLLYSFPQHESLDPRVRMGASHGWG